MWASSADMCDLWCKEAISKNTQNRHVGLSCGHEQFVVQRGVIKKTLKIVMWASRADMSNSWSKMVLSRITYFDHVGL